MTKDVDPATLARLLDLQAEDNAIGRLELRRESLPEAQKLEESRAQLGELEADLDIARKQADEIAREQSRIEDEIASLEQKLEREEGRLFSGSVSNPRELSSLQAEVEMFKRKRAEHEDSLLEVMVQRDQSSETTARLTKEHAELTAAVEELAATVKSLTTEIEAELVSHSRGRDEVAGEIPADLLKLYDQIRSQKGGIGAARLSGGTCEGCHTQLPAVEVERLHAEGGLQRCDNCRRILVVV